MRSTMSILGLWTYDNTVFSKMVVPAGVDKNELVDALLYELAELEVIYPNPDFMKDAIGAWSRKELPVWDRVARAANANYDPIENYDRREEWDDTSSSSASGTNTVVGYNSTTQTPESGSSSSGSASGHHSGRTHGNIGVTTSQQMLEQELALAPKLCIDDYIIDSFKRRFCLVVY